MKKPLPIGVENFDDMIRTGYYYIDKTYFIKELLDLKGKVNLFTRPRRFGKTLNLSMLRYFFEDTGDAGQNERNRELFSGLKIMAAGEEYVEQMGQYPVLNLTLKSAKQPTFESAYGKLKNEIADEFKRHSYILENGRLALGDEELFRKIASGQGEHDDYSGALKFLSKCLYETTGNKMVLLIDEYDVPLENAYFRGFYREMVDFIRSLFESALKTNEYLQFAVITGCLRISRETPSGYTSMHKKLCGTKESIFTGLNHLNIVSVLDKNYSEHFGFTEAEVVKLMEDYGAKSCFGAMREWYDGYTFGNTEVYNPWSVIKFMYDLRADLQAFPRPYWVNTSSNDIIKDLIVRADRETKEQIEALLQGGTLELQVHEEVTYEDLHSNGENL